jgi:hypothetical protein
MPIKKIFAICAIVLLSTACAAQNQGASEWVPLFDGKSLKGWKVGDNAATFSVENGTIKVNGPVAHLFYVGDYQQHNFKDFEFKADVMTLPDRKSVV